MDEFYCDQSLSTLRHTSVYCIVISAYFLKENRAFLVILPVFWLD